MMRHFRQLRHVGVLVVIMAIAIVSGCGGTGSTGGTSASGEAASGLPEALSGDTAAAADLAVTAEGSGAAVANGSGRAAVYVPAGAAPEGSTWTVTPLTEAPAGVPDALTPGVYVSTNGADPTDWCTIGFSILGTVSPDATIVKLADDGTVAEVIPTAVVEYNGLTLLTAYVDGFSAYTTAEEDAAARDKAFVDRAQARGQEVDWTIKVVGSETQEDTGWTFNYDFDLFASGGDVGMGGKYTGYANMILTGTYEGPESIVSSFGTISGSQRDDGLTFAIVDAPLASLLTGESIEDPIVTGSGIMRGTGFGSFSATAVGPDMQGHVEETSEAAGPIPFTIKIVGEDVQLEIENVGIFPGKILRTTK